MEPIELVRAIIEERRREASRLRLEREARRKSTSTGPGVGRREAAWRAPWPVGRVLKSWAALLAHGRS